MQMASSVLVLGEGPYEECSHLNELLVWANKDNLSHWFAGYCVLLFSHLQYNLVFDPQDISIKATPVHMATRMQQREWWSDLNSLPLKAFSSLMFKNKLKNLAQTAQKLTAIHQRNTPGQFSATSPPPTPVFRYPWAVHFKENWSRIFSLWSSGCHSINGGKKDNKS